MKTAISTDRPIIEDYDNDVFNYQAYAKYARRMEKVDIHFQKFLDKHGYKIVRGRIWRPSLSPRSTSMYWDCTFTLEKEGKQYDLRGDIRVSDHGAQWGMDVFGEARVSKNRTVWYFDEERTFAKLDLF